MYARQDGINLRITAKAATEAAARKMLLARETEIRQIIGNYIWGIDAMTMEGEISRLLGAKKMTMAVSESFTGGMLAYSLSGDPDSPRFFKGGIIIPGEGEANAATASDRADAARSQFKADVGMAIEGDFVTTGKRAGGRAFIAVKMPSGRHTATVEYPGKAPQVVRRTINYALVYLMNLLK